jgi:hypothetical protein
VIHWPDFGTRQKVLLAVFFKQDEVDRSVTVQLRKLEIHIGVETLGEVALFFTYFDGPELSSEVTFFAL